MLTTLPSANQPNNNHFGASWQNGGRLRQNHTSEWQNSPHGNSSGNGDSWGSARGVNTNTAPARPWEASGNGNSGVNGGGHIGPWSAHIGEATQPVGTQTELSLGSWADGGTGPPQKAAATGGW